MNKRTLILTGEILGQRTSKMSKREFSDLLDMVYAFGSDRGIVFADISEDMRQWH